MTTSVHVVCPACSAINRVPGDRLANAPACGQCHRALFRGEPVSLDPISFDRQSSRGDLPLLVDFWAPWCGPCKMMAPEFVRAAQRLEPTMRLAKVDTEAHPDLGARFAIRSIPTLVLFQHGRELARRSGAITAVEIERWARGAST